MTKAELRWRISDALFNLVLENPEKVFPDASDEDKDMIINELGVDGRSGLITFPTTARNEDGSHIYAKIKVSLLK